MDEPEHKPTLYCYRSKGCRRPECVALNALHIKTWRSKASKTDPRMIPHGLNGYVNYLCRCDVCKAAKADEYLKYRERKWEESLQETPAEAPGESAADAPKTC